MRSCDVCWSENGEFVPATMRVGVGEYKLNRYLCSPHFELLEVE